MQASIPPAGLAWHGGQLETARRHYSAAPLPWLDLSTGIAPWAYPVGPLADRDWQRLPEPEALLALEEVAAYYFRVDKPDQVVAVPGSDMALRLLARLIPAERVGVVGHSYSGYRKAWPHAEVMPFERALKADLLICANPNNPDGAWIEERHLQRRRNQRLVDEAFADADPRLSLLPRRNGAVVLRSFGKFFGLAGLRLGFVIADRPLAQGLRDQLGDWPISGPAIALARRAYADRDWHEAQRQRLKDASARLKALLDGHGLADAGGTAQFWLAETSDAAGLFDHLCCHGILVRPFAERPLALRFGLPGNERDWSRLTTALNQWSISR